MPGGLKRFFKGGLKGLFITKAQRASAEVAAGQQVAAEAAEVAAGQQVAAEAAEAAEASQQASPYPPESIKKNNDVEQRTALDLFIEENNIKSIRRVYINPETVQKYFNNNYSLKILIRKVNNLWNNLSETDASFRYNTYLSNDPNFPSIFKTDTFRDNFLATIPNKEGRKGQLPSDMYELYLQNSTNSVSNFNSKYLIPYFVSILNALLVRLPEEIAANKAKAVLNEARWREAEEKAKDEEARMLYDIESRKIHKKRRLAKFTFRIDPNENEPLLVNVNPRNNLNGGRRRSHNTRCRKSSTGKTRRNRRN